MKRVKTTRISTCNHTFSITSFAEDLVSVSSGQIEEKAISEVYGRINIQLQSTKEGDVKINELKSNVSRVGIKGEYKVDHGLNAIYKLEQHHINNYMS